MKCGFKIMKYKIRTSFGCTADSIEINDKLYFCEDSRYGLNEEEREQFHEDLFKEIKRMLKSGEISITNIIELLHVENVEFSEICDQCFDSVTTTTYEEFEIN